MGKDVRIVVAEVCKEPDGGLGISLEGTVDVEGGVELRPHHYIRSVRPGGPIARAGVFRAGDELLEVNGVRLLGLHHLEVVALLKALPSDVVLVCCRIRAGKGDGGVDGTTYEVGRGIIDTSQHKEAFASRNILGGSLQNLLHIPERLVKAKSESSLSSFAHSNISMTPSNTAEISPSNRSRSLEGTGCLGGVAMWKDSAEKLELIKGDHGLGFSILDYQDPMDSSQTVIVVRSLIAGGVAAKDGRLRPGDRLMAVNGISVARQPLHRAVHLLKQAPKGPVELEIARPVTKTVQEDSVQSQSSDRGANSSDDDRTGPDDFYECLDSYGEGLQVVQICLDDAGTDECCWERVSNKSISCAAKKDGDTTQGTSDATQPLANGDLNKADEVSTPDELPDELCRDIEATTKAFKANEYSFPKTITREHSKEVSTSDEMVFAVTPTGLERISYEKYWQNCKIQVEDKPALSRIHSDESWKDCRSTICSPLEKSPLSERKPLSSNGQLNISNQDFRYIDDDRSIERTSPLLFDENSPKTIGNNINVRQSKTQEAEKIIDDILNNPSILKLLDDRSSTNNTKDNKKSIPVHSSSDNIHIASKTITGQKFVVPKIEKDLRKLSLQKQLSLASDDDSSIKLAQKIDRQSVSQDLTLGLSASQELAKKSNLQNGMGHINILKSTEFKSQQMLNLRADRSTDQTMINSKSASQQLLYNAANEAYQQRLKNDFQSQQLFESRPMNRTFKSQQTLTRGVRIQLMEYYNDHEQCLEEYRKQKAEEEEQKRKQEEEMKLRKDDEELKRQQQEKLQLEMIDKIKHDESHLLENELRKKTVEKASSTNKLDTPKEENNSNSIRNCIGKNNNTDYEDDPVTYCELLHVENTNPQQPKKPDTNNKLNVNIANEVAYAKIIKVGNEKRLSIELPHTPGAMQPQTEILPSASDKFFKPETRSIESQINSIPDIRVPLNKCDNKSRDPSIVPEFKIECFPQDNQTMSGKPVSLNTNIPEMKSPTDALGELIIECHQCFLESMGIQQPANITIDDLIQEDEEPCPFCEALRDMLEGRPLLSQRRVSAPAILDLGYSIVTYDPGPLDVPDRNRRKSTGPLAFYCNQPTTMTVTADSQESADNQKSNETRQKSGLSRSTSVQSQWGPKRVVSVLREPGKEGLGISIVGGKADLTDEEGKKDIVGIFVKNVSPKSPAEKTGGFQTGDRILEVDGVDLRNASHEKAVAVIRGAESPVKFIVQSLLHLTPSPSADFAQAKLSPQRSFRDGAATPTDSCEAQETGKVSRSPSLSIPVIKEPSVEDDSPALAADNIDKDQESINSADKKLLDVSGISRISSGRSTRQESEDTLTDEEGDDIDETSLSGRTCSAGGNEIDRASAANVKRTTEEIASDTEKEDEFGYTTNKVRKKYTSLGDSVLSVQLERGPAGLGLSLAGHRDRTMMAVFVCGMNPSGAAARGGQVKVGDEILEVNGIVLHGRCHLNASAIIKGLAGPVFKLILLRRKSALQDVAVKPITQFPVTLSYEEDYSSFKNVRTVTIKKGTQSLGIMIIEGRHQEVGRGIFISDIQDGSPAQNAGLKVGDMILAVNKDTLLGCEYATAASTLKKTEGAVVLTVCNPNDPDKAANAAKPPSGATLKAPSAADPVKKESPRAGGPASRPGPSPARIHPIVDPATCPIETCKETYIEIHTEGKALGIVVAGGKDTQVTGGVVVHEVYPDGPAGKDGRLKPGDQLLEVNSVKMLPDLLHERVSLAVKQLLPKMRMVVYRAEPLETTTIEVQLVKKPGKGLGLCLKSRKGGSGVYVSDIIPGSPADVDGRIALLDSLTSVNGIDLTSANADECATTLKVGCPAGGKVTLVLTRWKPTARR